jgi:hypothetical protein
MYTYTHMSYTTTQFRMNSTYKDDITNDQNSMYYTAKVYRTHAIVREHIL